MPFQTTSASTSQRPDGDPFPPPDRDHDPEPQHHRGDVVALRGALGEVAHVGEERLEQLLRLETRGCCCTTARMRPSPYSSPLGRHRFRHAVAEDDQPVAGVERDGLFFVVRALEQADDRPAALEPPEVRSCRPRAAGCGRRCSTSAGRPAQRAVHQRHEPRLDAAAIERQVDLRIVCDGVSLPAACAAKMPCIIALRSAAGRPLAGDVAEREAERPVGEIDVVVEVAADRPARQRRGRGAEVSARSGRPWAAAPAGSRPRSASPAPSAPSPSSRDRDGRSRSRPPLRWRASRARRASSWTGSEPFSRLSR